jgi:hypothetical protein
MCYLGDWHSIAVLVEWNHAENKEGKVTINNT